MGEKDFQQFFLVRNYLKKRVKSKIILCKTIRDNHKLALSSRNLHLNNKELNTARLIAKRLSKSKNEILLTGFCSCFTSFSGFIFLLYELINQGNFLKTFFYINIFVILNLIVMHCGFTISRKFN